MLGPFLDGNPPDYHSQIRQVPTLKSRCRIKRVMSLQKEPEKPMIARRMDPTLNTIRPDPTTS
jgi:hypothetical protein